MPGLREYEWQTIVLLASMHESLVRYSRSANTDVRRMATEAANKFDICGHVSREATSPTIARRLGRTSRLAGELDILDILTFATQMRGARCARTTRLGTPAATWNRDLRGANENRCQCMACHVTTGKVAKLILVTDSERGQ